MCVSFLEFVLVIVYGIVAESGDRRDFLLGQNSGLSVFITAIVCFIICSQWLALIPPFGLPFDIGCRSSWGYAYAGELAELEKIKFPRTMVFKGQYGNEKIRITSDNQSRFWDAPCGSGQPEHNAAFFAMAKGYTDVVDWLEERGAKAHQIVTPAQALDQILQEKEKQRK